MKISTLLVSLSIGLLSLPIIAGTKDGGGGKGVICGNTLRVLDLYESEVLDRVAPGPDHGSFEKNLAAYSPKFMPTDSTFFNNTLIKTLVLSRFRDIPAGESLPDIHDVTVPAVSEGCKLVQIAIYKDRKGIIQRDRKLWDRLSSRDQVALVLHELLYLVQRVSGETTSDFTRWGIGLGMSNASSISSLPTIVNESKLWCAARNGDEVFEWVTVNEKRSNVKGVALYFKSHKSEYQSGMMSAFVPGISVEEFTVKSQNFSAIVNSGENSSTAQIETETGRVIKVKIKSSNSEFSSGSCTYIYPVSRFPLQPRVKAQSNNEIKAAGSCEERVLEMTGQLMLHDAGRGNRNGRIEGREADMAISDFDEDLRKIAPQMSKKMRLNLFHFILKNQRAPKAPTELIKFVFVGKKYSISEEQVNEAMKVLYCK